MKKKIWQLMLLMSVVWGCLGIVAKADSLNYKVTTDLPKNQITQGTTYFDLKVKPGQKQTLTIHIKNSDSKQHQYRISTNRAVTNGNGVIDYSQPKAKADSSLTFNLNDAVSKASTVTVAAKSTKKVQIKLIVPEKSFKGIALGGINITQVLDKAKKTSGVSIRNQYAYVIGLQLRETKKITTKPVMKLIDIKAKQINYQNYVTAKLQNTQPVIMHGLKVTSYVTAVNSDKKVLSTTKENMAMAPNSSFNFAIGDGNKQLKAGNYTLHLTATASDGKYKWNFTCNFTISEQKAKQLNNTAINQPKSTNYFWWFVGFGIVIVLLLGVVIWLLVKNRRKNQD